MRYVFLLLILLLASCQELDPKLEPAPAHPEITITGTPKKAVIERGQRATHEIFVKLDDPDRVVDEAVIFLYVGHVDSGENGFRSVSDPIVMPNIFATPLPGASLRKGVSTEMTYTINEDALLGDYDINIQIFEGNETSPASVKQEDLLGIRNIRFIIVE